MESFLSAVHNFTVLRIHRVALKPIDPSALAWLPVIGILSALLGMSFYLPLAALYLPLDVAIIPGLIAVCWLRGFKPEIDFCQLCDLLFGHRKHFTARPILRGILSGRIGRLSRVPDCPVSLYLDLEIDYPW